MDTRALQTFIAVAEELHFGRAAKRLHLAQQAVSQHVSRLERDLGAELLHRTTRRVELTGAGAAMLEDGRRILEAMDQARRRVRAVQSGRTGTCRVAYHPSAVTGVLPGLVSRFAAVHADVELRLVEAPSPRLESLLTTGEVDLALVGVGADLASFEQAVVATDRTVLVVPRSHPLSGTLLIRLTELREEPLVLYDPDLKAATHRLAMQACHDAGFSPIVAQYASSEFAVLGLVAAGVGIGLTSAMAAGSSRLPLGLVELDPPIPLPYRLVWRAGCLDGPALAFRELAAHATAA